MKSYKTQFEIHYTRILNFAKIGKEIISPFQRLAELNYSNLNTINETLNLNFVDEGYIIECRWDRIVFLISKEPENLIDHNGPLTNFITIFNKFKLEPTFGKIKNIVLARWIIKEQNDDFEVNVSEFKSNYFKDLINKFDDVISDIGITIDFKSKDKIGLLNFGPYNPKEDIAKFNLFSQDIEENNKLEKTNGILIQCITSNNTGSLDVSIESFKVLYTFNKTIVSKLE